MEMLDAIINSCFNESTILGVIAVFLIVKGLFMPKNK